MIIVKEVAHRGPYVEHVLHVVHRDERIVDRHDLDFLLQASSTHHQTSDTTEAIDSNFDRPGNKHDTIGHVKSQTGIGTDE